MSANINQNSWDAESVCIHWAPSHAIVDIATAIYQRTCRTDFSQPGFCLVNLGSEIDSAMLRRLMVEIKLAMSEIHRMESGKSLAWLSAARFDQQETTRPHLDGGPPECFLMLGYEPSDIESEMRILDYTRFAHDHGMSPEEFMKKHNPMFQPLEGLLESYTTRIPCFSRTDYQIICVNNSSAPIDSVNAFWQGTLHTASILTPDDSKRRVINSTMIASVAPDSTDEVSSAEIEEFMTSTVVCRRGYDKQHLEDDA